MTKIYLCSFASPDLDISVNRFIKQSSNLNFYDNINVYRSHNLSVDIKKQIESFFNKNQKRLYGYACWKPYIIKNYLEKLPKDSILQYSDIGCHFNPRGLKKLEEYKKICFEKNILTFQYKIPNWKNSENYRFQEYFDYQYCKGDTWKYFNLNLNSDILNTQQIWSGTIFFKNNDLSYNILAEWEKISKLNFLIDDSSSMEKNHKDFVQHRHDQSIFSILCKKRNVYSLSASECEWAEYNNKRTWEHLKNFPILAKRDKKFNLFKRFISKQKANIKKLFSL